jgi:gamma-glutamyltranspeptidase/glutathione hydrolase
VAAENDAAAEAGASVLERGGTAIDAAVAMAFVSAVTQPTSCGLGGGGFAVTWDGARREASVIDFREAAPGGLRLRDHLGNAPPWEKRGVLVGVPGFTAGLAELHAAGGKLPWSDLVGPAAKLAEDGFVVEPWLATTIGWSLRDLRRVPGAAFLLAPDGTAPAAGSTLHAPALARTLRAIAADGPQAMRGGQVVDDLVRSARAAGSSLVGADVASYAAVRREPLRVPFGGFEVLLVPPPSGGGVTVAQQLLAFPPDDLAKLAPADAVHLGAEGMRFSIAERRTWVGDPAFTRADLAQLLDPARLADVRRRLPRTVATVPSGPAIEDGGTCHLVAWDGEDRVVSLTTSVGGMFGAKVLTEGGYFLGDALGDFAHDALGQRAITRGPNIARGGARPVSSMAPVIVLSGGAPALALGASGGARIPSSVLQVLQRVLARDEPLERAIDAPRWHAPSAGGLQIEEGLSPLEGALRERGEALDVPRPTFAAVTAVRARRSEGALRFEAAADPRKSGKAKILAP